MPRALRCSLSRAHRLWLTSYDRAAEREKPIIYFSPFGRGDDRSLRIFLTLSNLRGVPYSFSLFGRKERFGMLNHGDYLDFKIGFKPAKSSETYTLKC
jgi:hypothetical protein